LEVQLEDGTWEPKFCVLSNHQLVLEAAWGDVGSAASPSETIALCNVTGINPGGSSSDAAYTFTIHTAAEVALPSGNTGVVERAYLLHAAHRKGQAGWMLAILFAQHRINEMFFGRLTFGGGSGVSMAGAGGEEGSGGGGSGSGSSGSGVFAGEPDCGASTSTNTTSTTHSRNLSASGYSDDEFDDYEGAGGDAYKEAAATAILRASPPPISGSRSNSVDSEALVGGGGGAAATAAAAAAADIDTMERVPSPTVSSSVVREGKLAVYDSTTSVASLAPVSRCFRLKSDALEEYPDWLCSTPTRTIKLQDVTGIVPPVTNPASRWSAAAAAAAAAGEGLAGVPVSAAELEKPVAFVLQTEFPTRSVELQAADESDVVGWMVALTSAQLRLHDEQLYRKRATEQLVSGCVKGRELIAGKGKKRYVRYLIELVTTKGAIAMVLRYSELRVLFRSLRAKFGAEQSFPFPKKRFIGDQFSEEFLNARQTVLNDFVMAIVRDAPDLELVRRFFFDRHL
jgi:hypothetical protein